jgi:hypothetical protein
MEFVNYPSLISFTSQERLCTMQFINKIHTYFTRNVLLYEITTTYLSARIAGVLDFIHRPDLIVTRKKKNKHNVSETGSVSVLR